MTVSLSQFAGAGWQFFDDSGIPLSGGLIYTYLAGTTTPATTYTSSTGGTPHTNPIVLDAAGRVPNEIWVTTGTSYKFVVHTSADVLIRSYDNILGGVTSASVSFTQSGTGAVTETVQDVLRRFVNVQDFGADPTGMTDSTTAIQNALNASKWVDFGRKGDMYIVSDAVTVQTGSWLSFHGATVTQTGYQKPMFDVRNTTGVTIEGGNFVGKAESPFVNSASSLAICVRGQGATNLTVRDNTFTGFCYSPLMVASGGTNIEFIDNFVTGPGTAVLSPASAGRRNCTGVTIVSSAGVLIQGNIIKDTSQGLIVGQESTDVVIQDNIIKNTLVEHGMYCDSGIKRMTIANNVVHDTCGHGIKVQWYDDITTVPSDVTISDNTIYNVGTEPTINGDGIICLNSIQNTVATITGITAANPAVFTTSAAHGLTAGDVIVISGVSGMVNSSSAVANTVNDTFIVNTTPLSTTFTVKNYTDTALNTTGWSAYTSGGSVKKPVFGLNFSITGNTIRTVTQDGIGLRYLNNATIANNVIDTVSRAGIEAIYIGDISFSDNIISNVQKNGMYIYNPLYFCTIKDNFINRAGLAADHTSGASSGILVAGDAGIDLSYNNVVGESTQTKMRYGIQLGSGDKRTYSIDFNRVLNAETAGIFLWNDTPNVYALKTLRQNISESALGNNVYSGITTSTPGWGTTWRDFFGDVVPASGTWNQGDRVWRQFPAAGEPMGWICLAGGSPGTWYPFAAVQGSNAYSVTNPTTDRALNVTGDTLTQVAAVLGTLIADLQTAGVLKS